MTTISSIHWVRLTTTLTNNNTMNKLMTISFLLLGMMQVATAQYKGVTFDYEKAVFGENQPLPAETHLMLQGQVAVDVGMVELDILDAKGRDNRLPIYTTIWKRSPDNLGTQFLLPVNFRLKGSSEYDFYIKYFRAVGAKDAQDVEIAIQDQINTYLEQVIVINKNTLTLNQSRKDIIRNLDKIVHKRMTLYRSRTSLDFEGFSELVEDKLKQLSHANLRKGKLIFGKKDKDEAKESYREKLVDEFKLMVNAELNQYMDAEWFKLVDNKYIDNYTTEARKKTIALQAGFGGAYLSGDNNNTVIGASPFVGFAFPLARPNAKAKFFHNLAINAGVFLLDFEGANGATVSGPIFKRPTYVGLSYKVFRFININAGATFLESGSTAGQVGSNLGNNVYIRPYIGISAQVDLWVDFSK